MGALKTVYMSKYLLLVSNLIDPCVAITVLSTTTVSREQDLDVLLFAADLWTDGQRNVLSDG